MATASEKPVRPSEALSRNQLLEMYYFEERTLEDAGGALGLSKSWACRLHARAVDLLRAALADAL